MGVMRQPSGPQHWEWEDLNFSHLELGSLDAPFTEQEVLEV